MDDRLTEQEEQELRRIHDYHGNPYEVASVWATLDAERQRIADLEAERDEARYYARILAHAYEHDSRPPNSAVAAAMAYPVYPARAALEASDESP